MEDPAVVQCQKIIEYQFRNPDLLRQALTHASVSPTRLHSNERMEFLGDAVLGLSVCASLYNQYEDLLEGEMTKIKSVVVSRMTCAEVSKILELCGLLSLGRDMSDPNRIPESVSAAIFEAVIGAIYIDGGFAPANEFILRCLQPHIDNVLANTHRADYKSMLQQHAQKISSTVPEYVLLDEKGPDHSKCFEVFVLINGRNFPGAWGRSKKHAEQAAAQRALVELGLVDDAPTQDSPEDPE